MTRNETDPQAPATNACNYCEITDSAGEVSRIAYRDSGGDGAPVLLLHGLASFSGSWEPLLGQLPPDRRYIRPDGLGFCSVGSTVPSTGYALAELLVNFVRQLDLRNLTLVGHAMGAEIALLMLRSPELRRRVSHLALLAPTGLQSKIPPYIEEIAATSPNAVWLRFAKNDFIAGMILEYAYSKPERIAPEIRQGYAAMLAAPGYITGVIEAARAYRLPERALLLELLTSLRMPVLLLWGGDDPVIPLEARSSYTEALKQAETQIIPDCGHLMQEELPQATAERLSAFLARQPQPQTATAGSEPAENATAPGEEEEPAPRLRLSKLFDHWSAGAVFFLLVLKFLQFLRHLGARAEENGWRKVTGIFLRNEYSKFVLASFRLTYAPAWAPPANFDAARTLLVGRIAAYLMHRKELHWKVEPGFFSFHLRKIVFCDLVVARTDAAGHLRGLEVHFDARHPDWLELKQEQTDIALAQIVTIYNQCRRHPARLRTRQIAARLRRWVRRSRGLTRAERRNMALLIERVMSAVFVYCEELPSDPEECARKRLSTPDLKRFRHPGWGMLCVVARFTPDWKEVDLWSQFNHVTADGAPMQEMLGDLKREWGAAGGIVFPALTAPVSRPDTMYCGDGIFRARVYVDFAPLLELRQWLNRRYLDRMNGKASLAGLLLWGLSQHDFFKNKKMLLPVDMPASEGNHELGLVVIRPGIYHRDDSPLAGFFNFQRELNRRLSGTRTGRSESHEFLELCSMMHPIFYHIARLIAPRSLNEIVGTVGVSIIRDAELFVSPLTDFQLNGFMSLGSVQMPTANGGKAGALCVCGSRPQIRCYLEALTTLVIRFPEFLQLPPDWRTTPDHL